MECSQHHSSNAAAQHLPGQVLEQVLAHVPFRERVRAAAVCRAWRLHLSQCGLPLWQAANIKDGGDWHPFAISDVMSDSDGSPPPTPTYFRGVKLRSMFFPLQRWLWRHGGGLKQLQCSTTFSFGTPGKPDSAVTTDDSLLAALLTTLAAAAPSLQALRLDAYAAWTLANGSLLGIASMGDRLRQLALVGLARVTDDNVLAALAELPLLQDLALMFQDEHDKLEIWAELEESDAGERVEAPDMMRLLDGICMSCPALQTLALGHLTTAPGVPCWSPVPLDGKPLPAFLSRLSALSSLALHNVGWEFAPDGLPCLPQLRRLSLRGDCSQSSKDEREFENQLSTLSRLELLQAALPVWPGRLPLGLTKLVLSPLECYQRKDPRDDAMYGARFIRMHLPSLRSLRHLTLHGQNIADDVLQEVFTAAQTLQQLVSLHLVQCSLSAMPREVCELSQLQLLDLSSNELLQQDGFKTLAEAPLHELVSCRHLDLGCRAHSFRRPFPLQQNALRAIASMPALEQLALPSADVWQLELELGSRQWSPEMLSLLDGPQGFTFNPYGTEAQLAQQRGLGMPPIRVVAAILESCQWSAADVELPFGEVNSVLGVQLDCNITRGVPMTGSSAGW